MPLLEQLPCIKGKREVHNTFHCTGAPPKQSTKHLPRTVEPTVQVLAPRMVPPEDPYDRIHLAPGSRTCICESTTLDSAADAAIPTLTLCMVWLKRLTLLRLTAGPAHAQEDPLRAGLAATMYSEEQRFFGKDLCEAKSKMPHCINAVYHIIQRGVSSFFLGKSTFLILPSYSLESFFHCLAADASFIHCSFYCPSIAISDVLVV